MAKRNNNRIGLGIRGAIILLCTRSALPDVYFRKLRAEVDAINNEIAEFGIEHWNDLRNEILIREISLNNRKEKEA